MFSTYDLTKDALAFVFTGVFHGFSPIGLALQKRESGHL